MWENSEQDGVCGRVWGEWGTKTANPPKNPTWTTLPEPQKQKIVLECIFTTKSNFLRAHNALSTLIDQTDTIFKTETKKKS
jgi:hypothetical protein